jgi:cytochrome c oxidase subunit 4
MTRYSLTFAALLALTTLTLLLSFVSLGGLQIPVAIAIALGKSVLIALFFMHLVEQRWTNALASMTAVVLVVILLGLTVLDVVSRGRS